MKVESGKLKIKNGERRSAGFRAVEYIDEIAVDEETPFEVLAAQEEENLATNHTDNTNNFLRKREMAVIGVGNFAADHPEEWKTFHAKLHHPHATNAELARMRGVTESTVRRHVKAFLIACRVK